MAPFIAWLSTAAFYSIINKCLLKITFNRDRHDQRARWRLRDSTLIARSQCSLAVVSCSMCLSTSATDRLQLLFFLQQTTFSSPVRTRCSSEFRSLHVSVSECEQSVLKMQHSEEPLWCACWGEPIQEDEMATSSSSLQARQHFLQGCWHCLELTLSLLAFQAMIIF